MITAVDSSVLLDVFSADERFGPASREALAAATAAGMVVASAAAWAEIRARFDSDEAHASVMAGLGVGFDAIHVRAASRAGALWRDYRRRGGNRTRLIADFLVGAHALFQADALLARDRGFYRTYFSSLRLIEP